MVDKMIKSIVLMGTVGLMMLGAGSVPASANGGTGGFECTAVVGAVCIGSINGNSVEVDLGNVSVLNGTEVNALQDFLNNDAVNVANLDVQTQINHIAVDVADYLKNTQNISVCQIKVIEVGLVNTNIAKCS
jgi:hypothetical protein